MSAGVTQPFMMTFLYKSHTGNLFEFILQENHDDVDVPWKPDGILYPPTNYPGRENIDADSPFQLRILRFYKIPHFGFFFGVIFGQFFYLLFLG